MDFNSLNSMKEEGFSGFIFIHALFSSCQMVPDQPGIYMVLYPSPKRPVFLSKGSGGFFKSRDPNIPVELLQNKWVDDTLVVYIGKAGGTNGAKWSEHTLRQRLSQYMRFGQGKPVRHRGGRYIWQLRDCEDLLVCWRPISGVDGDPSVVESNLISGFFRTYGQLPFANLQH